MSAPRRLVVKAGTSVLTTRAGRLSRSRLRRLCAELAAVHAAGVEVVLVTSGAIALGMEALGLTRRPKEMAALQACAAAGQGRLIEAYAKAFARRGILAAQVLLTPDLIETRGRFLNARNTLLELLRRRALPVVNENDTVATEEIRFGDNDVLSVQTAHLIGAEAVAILSDVEGFFLNDGSRLRRVSGVDAIDRDLVGHLRDRRTETTVGGMRAKLEAARTAMRLGVRLHLLHGARPGVLAAALAGADVGTVFDPAGRPLSARKKWIAFAAPRRGALVVDAGARLALEAGKSLLAPGVRSTRGAFAAGEVVELEDESGAVFGRGKSRRAAGALEGVVVHRDDLVVWG